MSSPIFDAIDSIEHEYKAAWWAVEQLRSRSSKDPSILHGSDVTPTHINRCQEKLERTYIVRLFAEFESILRQFLKGRSRDWPRMRVETVINRVASRRHIRTDDLDRAHAVRVHRNELLHTGQPSNPLTLNSCRSDLCKFLSGLPHGWLFPR